MHTATNQSSSLASALLCVQQALQPAAKDGKNPYHATRYATLNSIMASCRELLISHGILLTQMPVVQPVELGQNVLALETRLTHVDTGEYLASTAIVPLPKRIPKVWAVPLPTQGVMPSAPYWASLQKMMTAMPHPVWRIDKRQT